MRILLLAIVFLPLDALAETSADPMVPTGLFQCRTSETSPLHALKGVLGFAPTPCPTVPGPWALGQAFADTARLAGEPHISPRKSFVKDVGTATAPLTYHLRFDPQNRFEGLELGLSKESARGLKGLWGEPLPILSGAPTAVWFNPKERVRALISDLRAEIEKDPQIATQLDGHRYRLELSAYTPVRELFGKNGPIQRDPIGKTVSEIERDFPELRIVWGHKLDDSGELVPHPSIHMPVTELDKWAPSANVEIADGRVARLTWGFGDGQETSQVEILTEILTAFEGRVVSTTSPRPDHLVVVLDLPARPGKRTRLTLTSRQRQFSSHSGPSGVARIWEAELSQ